MGLSHAHAPMQCTLLFLDLHFKCANINPYGYKQNPLPSELRTPHASFDSQPPKPSHSKDNLENFHWKLSLNLTILRFKSPRVLYLLLIHFHSFKCPEQDQEQMETRSSLYRSTLKVFSKKIHLFDSHSTLHNSS